MSTLKPPTSYQKYRQFPQKVAKLWRYGYDWLFQTPDRAIEIAYQAAKNIQNIEIEHFNHQKISRDTAIDIAKSSPNIMSYWQVCRDRNLFTIQIRLAEFKTSRSLTKITDSEILEKLKFIDEITSRYDFSSEDVETGELTQLDSQNIPATSFSSLPKQATESIFNKKGIIPGSVGRTINRVRGNFSPQAEENFVRNYRISRNRTRISIRFLLILIIVPLLTQQLSKQLLVNFVISQSRGGDYSQVFLNPEMEEEAFKELNMFERELQFKNFLKTSPKLSIEEIEIKVKEKTTEIYQEFLLRSNNSVGNVFADLISLGAFAMVIATNRRAIHFLKEFMDQTVYGLSDSAKAFLIILFTDIFVGFHSPHGWEVLLDSFAKHLGLPPNESAIFFFIATFPVILNTIFKYWIFRYLSRLSPSALATLKEMDE